MVLPIDKILGLIEPLLDVGEKVWPHQAPLPPTATDLYDNNPWPLPSDSAPIISSLWGQPPYTLVGKTTTARGLVPVVIPNCNPGAPGWWNLLGQAMDGNVVIYHADPARVIFPDTDTDSLPNQPMGEVSAGVLVGPVNTHTPPPWKIVGFSPEGYLRENTYFTIRSDFKGIRTQANLTKVIASEDAKPLGRFELTDLKPYPDRQWIPLPTPAQLPPPWIYKPVHERDEIFWDANNGQFYLHNLSGLASAAVVEDKKTAARLVVKAEKPKRMDQQNTLLNPFTSGIFDGISQKGNSTETYKALQRAASRLSGSWSYSYAPKNADQLVNDGFEALKLLHDPSSQGISQANCNIANLAEFVVAAQIYGFPVRLETGVYMKPGPDGTRIPKRHAWCSFISNDGIPRLLDATPTEDPAIVSLDLQDQSLENFYACLYRLLFYKAGRVKALTGPDPNQSQSAESSMAGWIEYNHYPESMRDTAAVQITWNHYKKGTLIKGMSFQLPVGTYPLPTRFDTLLRVSEWESNLEPTYYYITPDSHVKLFWDPQGQWYLQVLQNKPFHLECVAAALRAEGFPQVVRYDHWVDEDHTKKLPPSPDEVAQIVDKALSYRKTSDDAPGLTLAESIYHARLLLKNEWEKNKRTDLQQQGTSMVQAYFGTSMSPYLTEDDLQVILLFNALREHDIPARLLLRQGKYDFELNKVELDLDIEVLDTEPYRVLNSAEGFRGRYQVAETWVRNFKEKEIIWNWGFDEYQILFKIQKIEDPQKAEAASQMTQWLATVDKPLDASLANLQEIFKLIQTHGNTFPIGDDDTVVKLWKALDTKPLPTQAAVLIDDQTSRVIQPQSKSQEDGGSQKSPNQTFEIYANNEKKIGDYALFIPSKTPPPVFQSVLIAPDGTKLNQAQLEKLPFIPVRYKDNPEQDHWNHAYFNSEHQLLLTPWPLFFIFSQNQMYKAHFKFSFDIVPNSEVTSPENYLEFRAIPFVANTRSEVIPASSIGYGDPTDSPVQSYILQVIFRRLAREEKALPETGDSTRELGMAYVLLRDHFTSITGDVSWSKSHAAYILSEATRLKLYDLDKLRELGLETDEPETDQNVIYRDNIAVPVVGFGRENARRDHAKRMHLLMQRAMAEKINQDGYKGQQNFWGNYIKAFGIDQVNDSK